MSSPDPSATFDLPGRGTQTLLASRDERGAIPAEVAWIAGIVVLALAVIVILTTVTTGAANGIKLK